jgi:hypothetical protein
MNGILIILHYLPSQVPRYATEQKHRNSLTSFPGRRELHPDLKEEYDKRKKQEEKNKQEQPATTAARPSAGSMKF